MTRPETCGIAGGTISFWVNVIDCTGLTGIISSRSSGKTGVRIYCTKDKIWYENNMLNNDKMSLTILPHNISKHVLGVTQNRINVLNEIFLLCLRFRIYLLATEFRVDLNRPAGWTHIVLNYFGPTARIKVYFNGAEVASDKTKSGGSRSTGDGRVVVGRSFTN